MVQKPIFSTDDGNTEEEAPFLFRDESEWTAEEEREESPSFVLPALDREPDARPSDSRQSDLRQSDSRPPDSRKKAAAAAALAARDCLYRHGVPAAVAARIVALGKDGQTETRKAGAETAESLLAAGLAQMMDCRPLNAADRRLMLFGPPAAGKTSLMSKLAALGGFRQALILTTDTERPGAQAQLSEALDTLGQEVQRFDPNGPLPPVNLGLPFLLDTPGLDARDAAALARLGELAAHFRAEPVLVLPAPVDGEVAEQFAIAARHLSARRAIVTQFDLARRLALPLLLSHAGLAIAGIGISPHTGFGFRTLNTTALAHRLVEAAAHLRDA